MEVAPLRLIMFTSEDCVYCPPIELIVREVVGSGMQDLVHVSTIDIDDDPEAASQYRILALPTLVINNEIVLQGGMDDDSVRDLLWSTLLNQSVSSEQAVNKTKNSLLSLTMTAMDSLNGSRVLRPSIGDYTHIGVYQQYLLSLYSLDPLIPYLLYNAGYQLGMYGMMHHVLTLLNPKLGKTSKRNLKFQQLAKAFELYFSDRDVLPILLAESARIIEQTETTILLQITDLASSSIRINVGEPLCGFIAGQLAGVTAAVMGMSGISAKCEEVMCLANGADHCLFKIDISNEPIQQSLPPLENKVQRAERRTNFYEVIHEMTPLIQDSKIMRKIQRRNVRDFVHISALQPIILSLKFLDRFSGTILFNGGVELGVFGPGKDLLSKLVYEKMGLELPISLDLGVKLLADYLTNPTTQLGREYGQVTVIKEAEGVYVLDMEENASVAGLSTANLSNTFCDFQAGFIAGRLNILIDNTPTVKEIECQGTGSSSCKFQITVE